MKLRIIAAATLVVGIGIGMVVSPFGPASVEAAKRREVNVYRCVFESGASATAVFMHNLTNSEISVADKRIRVDGTIADETTFTIGPRETSEVGFAVHGGAYELRTRGRLLVDAALRFNRGTASLDDDLEREARCT